MDMRENPKLQKSSYVAPIAWMRILQVHILAHDLPISLDSPPLADSTLNNICSREEVLVMKKILGVALVAVLLLGLTGAAMAWWGGPGMGMGSGPQRGMMGPGGGWGRGAGPCGRQGAAGVSATAIDEAKAKEIATDYVTKNLPGYTVEKFVKFERPRGTMYQVELKGPKDEVRYLHINPFGNVMPFGPGRTF
jgi:hypothetical protein